MGDNNQISRLQFSCYRNSLMTPELYIDRNHVDNVLLSFFHNPGNPAFCLVSTAKDAAVGNPDRVRALLEDDPAGNPAAAWQVKGDGVKISLDKTQSAGINGREYPVDGDGDFLIIMVEDHGGGGPDFMEYGLGQFNLDQGAGTRGDLV